MWSTTVEDVVNNYDNYTHPYTELKQCLCRAYGKSDMQKVNDLLNLPPLGSEKLSVLMDNILSLWPDTTTKNTSKLLLGLFLGSLPLLLGAQLANFPATTPGQLTATDATWLVLLRWLLLPLSLGCTARCHPTTMWGGTGAGQLSPPW